MASHGNFVSGFLSAGVGSLGGTIFGGGQFDPTSMLGSAVLGGFASILGGGKFANGAITGAFAYAAATEAQGGGANDSASSNDSATDTAASNSAGSLKAAVQASTGMGVDASESQDLAGETQDLGDNSDIETVVVTGQRYYDSLYLGQPIQIAANINRNLGKAAIKFLCKSSPGMRILQSVGIGAAIGGGRGAYTGFTAGEIFGGEVTLGTSGVPGALIGGAVGGTIGGASGVVTGISLASSCSAIGAYGGS